MDKNFNPSIVTVIWIERGILFTCINIIERNYIVLFNKKIIINNNKIRYILTKLFPELHFDKFTIHNKKNFYINIRQIAYNQDYIIDYLKNYEDVIKSKHINLIPWYDTNDPMIVYKYDKKINYEVNFINAFVNNFSVYIRSNFKNDVWDVYFENKILHNYAELTGNNIYSVLNYINKKLSNYISYYKAPPFIINNVIKEEIKPNINIIKNKCSEHEKEINNLKNIIEIINTKIKKINEIN